MRARDVAKDARFPATRRRARGCALAPCLAAVAALLGCSAPPPAPPASPPASTESAAPAPSLPVVPAVEMESATDAGAAALETLQPLQLDIIAMVNDQPITENEVKIAAYRLLSLRNLVPDSPEWFDEFRKLRRTLLWSLIDLELIDQQASRAFIDVATHEVEAVLDRVRKRFASAEEFQRALDKENLTLDDLFEAYRREIAIDRYKQQRFSPGHYTATEEEARRLYEERAYMFNHPGRVGAQQLVLAVPRDATAEYVRSAKATAERLQQEFSAATAERRTVDFAGVADELASKGFFVLSQNDYFTIRPTDMDPVNVALRQQPLFTISPVIEMKTPIEGELYDAFHIVQVTSHKEPFEHALEGILLSIQTEKAALAMRDWIGALRENADVRVVDPRYRK